MPPRRRPPRPGALTDLSPLRILKQIILLQLAYYATALVLIVFTALAAGKHITLDLLLGWRSLRGDVTEGWMLGLVWMLSSLICVLYILVLIARSKLVPDFAITIHFIHLIVTSLYTGSIPSYIFWWGLQIASTMLMVFLGMWSCQWRELRPINFGKTPDGVADGSRPGGHGRGSGILRALGYLAERVGGLGSGIRRSRDYEMLPQ